MPLIYDMLDLPKVVIPYLLHPLTAVEVFFPHSRPVSWFTQPAEFLPERDLSSLQGKVVLVTGGSAGLGKESILQLASLNPSKIYLAARSRTKGEAAIRDIVALLGQAGDVPQPVIEYLELDLQHLASVRDAARFVLSRECRLDILMLNAGIMATPPSRSQSGHDAQLCTNHIGHFLLTILLLPLLERTASEIEGSDVRVVTVSSEAHRMAPANVIDLIENQDQLCCASPYTAYGVSKAANILFAAELARRYGDQGITSVSVHPGIILTDLYLPSSSANVLMRLGLPPVARLLFDDVKHGALNQIWCAAGAKKEQLANGAYYTPVGRIRPTRWVGDNSSQQRLWDWTAMQISQYLE